MRVKIKTYLRLCLLAQILSLTVPAFAGEILKTKAIQKLCAKALNASDSNEVIKVAIDFFDSTEAMIVKPDPNGTVLNRLAHDLERTFGARVATLTVEKQKRAGFQAAWDTTQRVLILPQLDSDEAMSAETLHLIAHEVRHMFFKMMEAKGKSTILSGSAGQSLEELFTYPLSIRIAKGQTRLSVVEKFIENILFEEHEDQKFPGRLASEILLRFHGGESPQWNYIAQPRLGGSASLTFENTSSGLRDIIQLEVLKAYGREYVKVTVRSRADWKQAGFVMNFPARDAAGFLNSLATELEKAQPDPYATKAWQDFYERVNDRTRIINEIQVRSTVLAREIETELRAGQNANAPSSALINLVRGYLKIPVTPFN